jgi:hypothetical protein
MKIVVIDKPVRVQLSRRKGWRMPPNTVNVARPTKWGNQWKVGEDGDAAHCVAEYRRLVTGVPCIEWPKSDGAAERAVRFTPSDVDALRELRGKNLACWCPLDRQCHADVLLKIANK